MRYVPWKTSSSTYAQNNWCIKQPKRPAEAGRFGVYVFLDTTARVMLRVERPIVTTTEWLSSQSAFPVQRRALSPSHLSLPLCVVASTHSMKIHHDKEIFMNELIYNVLTLGQQVNTLHKSLFQATAVYNLCTSPWVSRLVTQYISLYTTHNMN